MNSVKITIPGRLPGMNEFIAACNRHKMAGAAMKKTAQEQCAWAMATAKRKGLHFNSCDVRIIYHEPNKRRDKDNISAFARKVIFDALQQMKIISNDGWEQVKTVTEQWTVDKKNPRIEVTLTEAAENEQH